MQGAPTAENQPQPLSRVLVQLWKPATWGDVAEACPQLRRSQFWGHAHMPWLTPDCLAV